MLKFKIGLVLLHLNCKIHSFYHLERKQPHVGAAQIFNGILDLVFRCFAMCFKGSVDGSFWPGPFRLSINKGLEIRIKCQTSVNVRKGIGILQWRSGSWVWTARPPRFILGNLSNATGCTSTTTGTVRTE